jgi:hypothetical protein
MKNYQAFIFKDYSFDTAGKTLTLHYSFDDEITFSETFRFNFAFADYDGPTLERALQLLFFMAGVSYYKAYPTTEIRVEKGTIDDGLAQFLATTWQAGLRVLLCQRSRSTYPYHLPDERHSPRDLAR